MTREEPVPPPCTQITRIEIWKGERTLKAFCKQGAVITMVVALSRGSGPKAMAGDRRTPEGTYHIIGSGRPSRFHRFIPIDYPSLADAASAHAAGRLSLANYQRIKRAHDQGRPPPGDTILGGELGFHGEGPRWKGDSADLDWTYGCFAVSDAEIDFLAERVGPGVPVLIHPADPHRQP